MTNEYPILFSAPMVQAILAGTKTQTRRVLKGGQHPYRTAQRLWVRETWGPMSDFFDYGVPDRPHLVFKDVCPNLGSYNCDYIIYRADGEVEWVDEDENLFTSSGQRVSCWKPSIFMPRWAARITLEVLSVGSERLQSLTDADAIAEGMPDRDAFHTLWDSLNAKRGYGWDTNPEVVRVEFKRVAA